MDLKVTFSRSQICSGKIGALFHLLPWDDETKGLTVTRCFHLCCYFSLCVGFFFFSLGRLCPHNEKLSCKWFVARHLSFTNKDRLAP